MIAILAALALAAAPPPADAAPEAPAATLEQLNDLYDQSCASREYGAYDDMCDQLRQQVKAAQIEADRTAQRKGETPRAAAHPAPKTPAAAPATPAASAGPSAKPPGGV